METTLERHHDIRPTGFAGAVGEQFRVLWTSRRPLFMAIALLAVLTLAGEPWSDNPMARVFAIWPVWLMAAPIIWGFAVWHNEGPSNRLYFWSQPVSRAAHSLARTVAGALWLVVLQAVLITAGALAAAADGEIAQFGMVPLAAWVNMFTGPLLIYACLSLLTIPSDYPIRWFLGFLFGVPFLLSLLDEWLGAERTVRFLLKPLGEEWGLGASILAPTVIAMQRLDDLVDGAVPATSSGPFDVATWWVAMPLWLLGMALALVWIARRHPDRHPRLRGLRSPT